MPTATKEETKVPTVTVPVVGPKRNYKLFVLEAAPFDAVTIAGHTFHRHTEPLVYSERTKSRERVQREGLIEPLSEADVDAITRKIPMTYVRWHSRERYRASVFEPTAREPMNPETDDPVSKFITMEPV
jgi:hypothetical protein